METSQKQGTSGPLFAVLSAVLFGATTPLAKLLLGGGVDPWLLAGLMYLGSGAGLFVLRFAARGWMPAEAPLRMADAPRLGLVALFGGVVGPVLLMIGLASSAASTAALLLNLESVATMLIAWVVLRENVDNRLLLGAGAILAGAVLLSWRGAAAFGPGSLAIAGACLAWGIDNNLSRGLSAADPLQVAALKGLAAGATNIALAFALGAHMPSPVPIGGAALLGLFGIGISLALFMLGLRHVGAARTGAYFATAPFVGAALGVILFHDTITARLIAAGVLMAVGLYLHLVERHAHLHEHEPMEHEHSHVHDVHHQHTHAPGEAATEPHTHRHRHTPLVHSHAHTPDLHHRHGHAHSH